MTTTTASKITTYRNLTTGETAPAHDLGANHDGRRIYQSVAGWEPVESYECDSDGNWLALAKPAKPKTIKITLSERRPVTIIARDWPIIASVESHDGKVYVQANTEWAIEVREHADSRRIVYGWRQAGGGGQYAGWRGADAGYIVDAVDGRPDEAETVRAIRRVGGVIGRDDLAAECIGELPAEAI